MNILKYKFYASILICLLSCDNFNRSDFKKLIQIKKPKNCVYETFKDFNFIDCKGVTKLDSNTFKNCFVVYNDTTTAELKSFLFINENGDIEIEMKKIAHKYYDLYAGSNKVLLSKLVRKDTLLYLTNDTLIYNMTYQIEKLFTKNDFDTLQYNLSFYRVQNNSSNFAIGIKKSDKRIFVNNLAPKNTTPELKKSYFYEGLRYKSFFSIQNNEIINRNVYSGVANGDTDFGDGWSKSFRHKEKVFYSIFKNYEIK